MVKQSNNRYLAVFLFSLLLTFFLVFLAPVFLFDAHNRFEPFYMVFSAITAVQLVALLTLQKILWLVYLLLLVES
jgi:hypothetical protein